MTRMTQIVRICAICSSLQIHGGAVYSAPVDTLFFTYDTRSHPCADHVRRDSHRSGCPDNHYHDCDGQSRSDADTQRSEAARLKAPLEQIIRRKLPWRGTSCSGTREDLLC